VSVGAVFLILAGFVPKLAAVIAVMPRQSSVAPRS
jgi:xanthine/uracil permease